MSWRVQWSAHGAKPSGALARGHSLPSRFGSPSRSHLLSEDGVLEVARELHDGISTARMMGSVNLLKKFGIIGLELGPRETTDIIDMLQKQSSLQQLRLHGAPVAPRDTIEVSPRPLPIATHRAAIPCQ